MNHVILPPNASADSFISKQLQAFEGPFVSTFLSDWIDLLFGYKQKGKEAANHYNVFFYLTYPDEVDLDSIEDADMRSSIITQSAHFGQCPLQTFSQPHPKKRPSLNAIRPLRDAMLLANPTSIFIQSSQCWLGHRCRFLSISDMDSSLLSFKPSSYQSILGLDHIRDSDRYFDRNSNFYTKDHSILSPSAHVTWPCYSHAPWFFVLDCNEYMLLECIKIGIQPRGMVPENQHSRCYSIEVFTESNQWEPVSNCRLNVWL